MTKIVCVVDNESKNDSNLKKEHGLSFWIETQAGVVLLDTGQTAEVLSHNLSESGLSADRVDVLALSHAHYDHTGGLGVFFAANKSIPLYTHSDIFHPRYSLRNGEYKSIGLAYTRPELAQYFDLHLSDTPVEIVPGCWTTGEIKVRPERVGGSEHLLIQTEDGWQPDPYRDDMSLVLVTEAGLVLICGCCHAGILNTLFHVERMFGDRRIRTIIGGTHLVSADDAYLEYVMDVLQQRWPDCSFFLNHCTGKHAFQMLSQAFGSRVQACPAGTVISIKDQG
jgi:7,8-dihydropterin-6-yl-methyl-4-(beta-D-ribofuranosyl)aminobenzene 5'-phosphate synthase